MGEESKCNSVVCEGEEFSDIVLIPGVWQGRSYIHLQGLVLFLIYSFVEENGVSKIIIDTLYDSHDELVREMVT